MATALILGATGGIGHEVATALHRHGWQINALHRDPTKAASQGKTPWIHWVKGDAMNAAEVTILLLTKPDRASEEQER